MQYFFSFWIFDQSIAYGIQKPISKRRIFNFYNYHFAIFGGFCKKVIYNSKFMKSLPILPITYVLKTAKLLKISTRFFYSFRLQKVGVLQRLNPQWIMKSCHDVLGTIRTSFTKLRWRGKKIPVNIFAHTNPNICKASPNICKASWLDGFLEMQRGWYEKNSGKLRNHTYSLRKKIQLLVTLMLYFRNDK